MRGAIAALRDGFLSLPAKPPWRYGLLCGVAVALPLAVGALSGRPRDGAVVALGAYFTAFGDTYGLPYGERAKTLSRTVPLLVVGFWLGSFLALNPWAAVLGVGLVAAAGAQWKAIGLPPVLAVVSGFYGGLPPGVGPPLMMGLGGILYCALALALWPARRLDPLKQALATASTAMADLLDGFDEQGEEWAALRQRASGALREAETASAAFHSPEDSDRSPHAVVSSLTRIFHESVALRSLRAQAVKAEAMPPELDEVVSAFSKALRVAAHPGGRPDSKAALAAVACFAERVAAVRDQLTPVQRAILGQVRRCMDRVGVAVRAVSAQATEGVRAPTTLPHLTWQLPPLSAEAAAYATRSGIAVAISMALVAGLHEQHGRWLVFTVLLALRPSYGDTIERVALRVVGTMIGSTMAALLLAAVPGHATLVVVVWAFATVGFALREVSYAYWSVFATPLALMLSDFFLRLDWGVAGARVLLTIGGGVLALLAARLLWPRGERRKLRDRVVDLLKEHASMVRTLAGNGWNELPEHTEAAGQAGERLDESLDKVDKEPGGRAPERLRQAVTDARRLRDDAILLAAVMKGAPDGTDATVAVLDAVADRMEAVAHAVRHEEPPPETDELDASLAEMADRVETLIEEASATDDTAVKRQLRHAATAHPALRTLTADALRLTVDVTG
ncbi:FUSC family protein [Nonomuraea sp. NPDC049152]|uniref:FUSC family protein n=1 Tax=Nonomuraea sp. NPDC049152 TaxID=3154350 RepID=UPI0033ECB352